MANNTIFICSFYHEKKKKKNHTLCHSIFSLLILFLLLPIFSYFYFHQLPCFRTSASNNGIALRARARRRKALLEKHRSALTAKRVLYACCALYGVPVRLLLAVRLLSAVRAQRARYAGQAPAPQPAQQPPILLMRKLLLYHTWWWRTMIKNNIKW